MLLSLFWMSVATRLQARVARSSSFYRSTHVLARGVDAFRRLAVTRQLLDPTSGREVQRDRRRVSLRRRSGVNAHAKSSETTTPFSKGSEKTDPSGMSRHQGYASSRSRPEKIDRDQAVVASLVAASKSLASKAGMDWIRPNPWVAYHTEKASIASGPGASTISTKS